MANYEIGLKCDIKTIATLTITDDVFEKLTNEDIANFVEKWIDIEVPKQKCGIAVSKTGIQLYVNVTFKNDNYHTIVRHYDNKHVILLKHTTQNYELCKLF